LDRAKVVVQQMANDDIAPNAKDLAHNTKGEDILNVAETQTQMTFDDLVTEDDIIAEIEALNLGEMTPLEGLNYLNELQQRLKNRLD
jgi:DNA mismatch repair protein MutS